MTWRASRQSSNGGTASRSPPGSPTPTTRSTTGWPRRATSSSPATSLPDRLRPGFHVAELGIGTGLNLLARSWRWSGRLGAVRIRYTGFEAFPLSANDMRAALAAFPEVADVAEPLRRRVGRRRAAFRDRDRGDLHLRRRARDPARWPDKADAWFLDGFAPARNPELWETRLLAEVARHTAPGGTAATYSAAGEVRRGLAAVGFAVERRPGYGRKRHMTAARLA